MRSGRIHVMTMVTAASFVILLITAGCKGHIRRKNEQALNRPPLQKDTLAPVSRKIDSLYKIYLSFDDGPGEGSENINRVALADSAMINVFIVGRNVFKNDSLGRYFQLYQSNPFVETGNHSFSHANKHYRLYYRNVKNVLNDIQLNQDTLHLVNKIVRLPGRNTWRINGKKRSDLPDDKAVADSLEAKGYRVFGWDIEWRNYFNKRDDFQPANAMIRIVENLITGKRTFKPGNVVILCHDPVFENADEVKQLDLFIQKMRHKKGYQLEHLSNYP